MHRCNRKEGGSLTQSFKWMVARLGALRDGSSGCCTVEYGLLVALIAVAIHRGSHRPGGKVKGTFTWRRELAPADLDIHGNGAAC